MKHCYLAMHLNKCVKVLLGGTVLFFSASGFAGIAQSPLFVENPVPGNLALVPSVEYPTILSLANLGDYSESTKYTGYFDSNKCYLYQYDSNKPAESYFKPAGLSSFKTDQKYRCTDTKQWSGNFLNWAATPTIDPFRSALTGGYRVVDTATQTILQKARDTGQSGQTKRTIVPNDTPENKTYVASVLKGAVPGSPASLYTRIGGLGARMFFSAKSDLVNKDSVPTHFNSSLNADTLYEVYIRVEVCNKDSAKGGVEANCKQYGDNWKPEGLIQEYSEKIRYSVFGYLNDHNNNRDGGVLRANQKFVGPQNGNQHAEWDASTGILVSNPNPDDIAATKELYGSDVTISHSGVINYINKFGELTTNNHKAIDPVSELYYTAVRYFKKLGNVPQYSTAKPAHNSSPSKDTKNQWLDGFPVITSWEDPIKYSCQKNVVLGIGDTNSHKDKNLPSGNNTTNTSNEPTKPLFGDSGKQEFDNTVDVYSATKQVAALQGMGSNLARLHLDFTGNQNSAYIAGLAYDAHTVDMRPTMVGKQTLDTYWVDVRENQDLKGPDRNQYYLAAKYGGFKVPAGFVPYPSESNPNPSPINFSDSAPIKDLETWHTNGEVLTAKDSTKFKRPDNFYVASDANAMVAQLRKAFEDIAANVQSSSASVAANSTRLDSGTYVYQASFNGSDWSGKLAAYGLSETGQVNPEPVWSTNNTGLIPAHNVRNVLTVSGTQGTPTTTGVNFSSSVEAWNALSEEQRQYLDGNDNQGRARINWLRGDRTNETPTGAIQFRARSVNTVLGDIVNSDPLFVGKSANYGYHVLKGKAGATYRAFLSQKNKDAIVVGANDGMLHAFDANSGKELFAYVPLGVYPNLAALTNPKYEHRYFVDGSPKVSDVYIDDNWRTIVVGTTGAGGKSVFALDVTDIANMTSSNVLWEYSASNLDSDTAKLGYTLAAPTIAHVKATDAPWIVAIGNGYESGDTTIKLLVLDVKDGKLIRSIDTGVPAVNNALGPVVAIDTDNDRVTDYIYGGDLLGNVWKFDLTSNNKDAWSVKKIFQAVDSKGTPQPITMPIVVGRHPESGLMLYLGTGKYFEDTDDEAGVNPQVQSYYAIRDQGDLVERKDLLQQTITYEDVLNGIPVRATSSSAVDYSTDEGWYMDLIHPKASVGVGERAITPPVLSNGRLIFSTLTPNADPCAFGGTSWLMVVDALSGSTLTEAVFDFNGDGVIDENDLQTIDGKLVVLNKGYDQMIKPSPPIRGTGINRDMAVIPISQSGGGKEGSDTTLDTEQVPSAVDPDGRQSWRQLQ